MAIGMRIVLSLPQPSILPDFIEKLFSHRKIILFNMFKKQKKLRSKNLFFLIILFNLLIIPDFHREKKNYFKQKRASPVALFPKSQQRRLHERYLISSDLSFGRLSNTKISLAEVIGLSLVLNRTAVLPRLESCMLKTEEFEQLFDSSSFSRASVLSSSGLDLNRICKHDVIYISVSKNVGNSKSISLTGVKTIELDEISLQPFLFYNDTSTNLFKSHPYDKYFLPTTASWAPSYMKDELLIEKLASLNNYRCIIIPKNFYSVNWARFPSEFVEVHRELVPSPTIREDVVDFLEKNELSSALRVPFIGIHLRMGDFLTSHMNHVFGFECNNNPELMVSNISNVLTRFAELTNNAPLRIILASDDYNSVCAKLVQISYPVITLDGASRFLSESCQGAIFDQEVLGASSFFFGDKMSTFSQAIHQIRTLRYGHPVDSTMWL